MPHKMQTLVRNIYSGRHEDDILERVMDSLPKGHPVPPCSCLSNCGQCGEMRLWAKYDSDVILFEDKNGESKASAFRFLFNRFKRLFSKKN